LSDVDGLMTADPKIVKNAKLLKEVSYTEAIEMALFGAKQIHPRTFEPLLAKKNTNKKLEIHLALIMREL
jgi:aspartate kinase (EC 2.7.2.4)